ncbi:ABC transporter ATP-binding protein [Athalassotoga saccharophila]|uniref:ABC transporter ATP-binding protein n=1 Tax=Athalassotoga saccharophila TaxID=1441386 RepID=UPI00137A7601|nr:energy-coupling factor transporter ATPase [Athalassotoga saccharophila]BBJ28688.1 putative HMP/thiamine import ATP-binding protein YkoD [Athalassotoga saccharophila]
MNAITIRNFYWKYPNFVGVESDFALKNINLDVKEGEFFGITGPSGSGKTTLCFAMMGLIPHHMQINDRDPRSYMIGSVKVFDEVVSAIEERNGKSFLIGKGVMSDKIGLVMQDPESQFLTMSVKQELSLGLRLMGLDSGEIEERIKEALKRVGMEDIYEMSGKIHPAELSGGQKQRLIIASFIAMRPKILILDEPTSDLDPAGKIEVIEAIQKLKTEGNLTVVLVEHNPELMQDFVDRMVVLNDGKIVAEGTPDDIYSNAEAVKKFNVYTPEIAELKIGNGKRATRIKELISKIPNAKFEGPKRRYPQYRLKPILEVENLDFSYEDGTHALKGLSFKVEQKEFVAIIGQNGSGKSTLSKILSGIEGNFSGSVKIASLDLHDPKNRRRMPYHVGYVFQNPDHQIFNRSVYNEVAYGLKNMGLSQSIIDEKVKSVLKSVDLIDKINEDPLFLGRGQKRRLGVASVLAMHPEIIIVDEPTTGQDYKMSREIMELLKKLNDDGTTIIVISHDMRLVAEFCPRSIVLNQGKILYDGPTFELFKNKSILDKASLRPPQIVRLSEEMISVGMTDDIFLTVEEMNNAISKTFV